METGRIHNPHYFELLRRENNGVIPREPGDNHCDYEHVVNARMFWARLADGELHNFHERLVRLNRHIEAVVLLELRTKLRNQDFTKLRARYTLYMETEDSWSSKMLRASNNIDTLKKLIDLYETMQLLMRDAMSYIREQSRPTNDDSFVTIREKLTQCKTTFLQQCEHVNSLLMQAYDKNKVSKVFLLKATHDMHNPLQLVPYKPEPKATTTVADAEANSDAD